MGNSQILNSVLYVLFTQQNLSTYCKNKYRFFLNHVRSLSSVTKLLDGAGLGSIGLNTIRHFVTALALHLVLHGVEQRWRDINIRWTYVSCMLKICRRADHRSVYSPACGPRRWWIAAREPLQPNFTTGARHFISNVHFTRESYLQVNLPAQTRNQFQIWKL